MIFDEECDLLSSSFIDEKKGNSEKGWILATTKKELGKSTFSFFFLLKNLKNLKNLKIKLQIENEIVYSDKRGYSPYTRVYTP